MCKLFLYLRIGSDLNQANLLQLLAPQVMAGAIPAWIEAAVALKSTIVVKPKWADLILSGQKTAEIRSVKAPAALIGATIGIAISGTNAIHGCAQLDAVEQISKDEFQSDVWRSMHCIQADDLHNAQVLQKDSRIYAYKLSNHMKFETPLKFKWQPGPIIWQQLDTNQTFKESLAAAHADAQQLLQQQLPKAKRVCKRPAQAEPEQAAAEPGEPTKKSHKRSHKHVDSEGKPITAAQYVAQLRAQGVLDSTIRELVAEEWSAGAVIKVMGKVKSKKAADVVQAMQEEGKSTVEIRRELRRLGFGKSTITAVAPHS